MTGASRLAARAALRLGTGVVTLAAPKSVWHVYAASLISVIVKAVDGIEDYKKQLEDKRHNALLVGPGAGVGKQTQQAVLAALAAKCSIVLDFDAITNVNAPPYLATAGSGDVLTGFIDGLLAQGLAPFESAAAAVLLHGEAATEFGEGLIAEDLPEALPPVLKRLQAPLDGGAD